MKIGDYEVHQQEKDKNEAFIEGIQEGEPFYTVQLDKEAGFDTKSQAEAIIISGIVRIENMLKNLQKH